MLAKMLLAVVLLFVFCLPPGILLTALGLEHGHIWLTSLGIGLLMAGVVTLDFGRRTWTNASGSNEQHINAEMVIEVLMLPALSILLFASLLDGGARFRACLYCYLIYLPGAVILLVKRARALTKLDLLYLKWGWIPIMTIGVPLLVRLSKGLI